MRQGEQIQAQAGDRQLLREAMQFARPQAAAKAMRHAVRAQALDLAMPGLHGVEAEEISADGVEPGLLPRQEI